MPMPTNASSSLAPAHSAVAEAQSRAPAAPRSWPKVLVMALIAVPLLSLGAQAVMWLRYGIDLPFFDDFRTYELWTAQSLALKDLFRPQNDTLYPVGIALDALAHRYLAGNVISYQLISMLALLGGILWLQWRLLIYALEDRLAAAAAFAFCIFMVQPGTYWGQQDMAYHQGLPTLFLLAALAVILLARWRRWLSLAAVVGLGLLAGMTYISGAAATLVMGLALMALARLRLAARDERRAGTLNLQEGAMALLAAALVTVPAQAWVILGYQRGQLHLPGGAWAFPWDPSYWVYLFAKVARALTLPAALPYLSLTLAAGLTVLALALAARLLRTVAKSHGTDSAAARVTTIFAVLFVMVAAYLAMLAAGRTNLQAADADFATVFLVGYNYHMHFFWITLLPPWFAAAGIVVLKGRTGGALPSQAAVRTLAMPALVFLVIAGAGAGGAFAHGAYYRGLMQERLVTQVACLREKLAALGEDMLCPALYPSDLLPSYVHGLIIGASFTRYFPLQPVPLGHAPQPLFRLSRAASEDIDLANVGPSVPTADGLSLQPTNGDPILSLKLAPGALDDCLVVDVTMQIQAAHGDFAQLFLLQPGHQAFAEPAAGAAPVPARTGTFAEVTLRGVSPNGFQNVLRIDPLSTRQPLTIKDLEVRCRVRHTFPWLKHPRDAIDEVRQDVL